MALFQPTFVTPDASWGIGNGTIDATQPLTVSWQVNGNSAMVAYEIVFYENDSASTVLHDTGRVALSAPYYGVDAKGNLNPFFNVTFTAADVESWGITNGGEYKLIITQWWSADDNVVQTSASAFETKTSPTITIDNLPSPLDTRDYEFTASYAQAQGDALNWIRWQLAYADDLNNPFYDTQNIYGTAELACYHDGFFNGKQYAVRVLIQTASGVDATTGWQTFNVEYDINELTGYINVERACGSSAVRVSWPFLFVTTGSVEGDYTLENGMLKLDEGSVATWDERNTQPIQYEAPWGIAFAGTLLARDCVLFSVNRTNGKRLHMDFDARSRTVTLYDDNTSLASFSGINGYAHLNVVVTENKVYLRQDWLSGGLYPAEDLYPSQSLFPRTDTIPTNQVVNSNITYTQTNITKVQIVGMVNADFLLVSRGTIGQEIIDGMMGSETYQPKKGASNYFYATFEETLDGGSLSIGNDDVVGFDVYRTSVTEPTLRRVGNISVQSDSFLDYAARSQQGPYTYYVYPIGENTYVTEPIVSDTINPCFWNWTLLECVPDDEFENLYHVIQEFDFGNNVISGTVSNNALPSQFDTFTRYPLIQKPTSQYQSGVLTSLIGKIDYVNHNGYYDTVAMRNAIWDLSRSTNPKFLKSRKGDLMQVEINDAITMETYDESREQAQTVELPWVEVADATEVSIMDEENA